MPGWGSVRCWLYPGPREHVGRQSEGDGGRSNPAGNVKSHTHAWETTGTQGNPQSKAARTRHHRARLPRAPGPVEHGHGGVLERHVRRPTAETKRPGESGDIRGRGRSPAPHHVAGLKDSLDGHPGSDLSSVPGVMAQPVPSPAWKIRCVE